MPDTCRTCRYDRPAPLDTPYCLNSIDRPYRVGGTYAHRQIVLTPGFGCVFHVPKDQLIDHDVRMKMVSFINMVIDAYADTLIHHYDIPSLRDRLDNIKEQAAIISKELNQAPEDSHA